MAQTPITEGTVVSFVTTKPFTSIGGTVINPDTVKFQYSVQGSTPSAFTWVNPAGDPTGTIVNTSVGNFTITLDTTGFPGTWTWQISGYPSSGLDTTKTKVIQEGTLEVSQASM